MLRGGLAARAATAAAGRVAPRGAAAAAAAARQPAPRRAGGLPQPARRWCAAAAGSRFPQHASPYEVLGVGPEATHAEMKRAYQQLVQEVHPDAQGGNADDFRRVQTAWSEVQSGPPANMVFGRDKDVKFELELAFWEKVDKQLMRFFGVKINWNNMFDRYDVRGNRILKMVLVSWTLLWFCWVCDPPQWNWMLYLFMAYLFDLQTGFYLMYLMLPYLCWRSLVDDLVEGMFVGPHHYWDIGRPTAYTMAAGIPNYWWHHDTQVFNDHTRGGHLQGSQRTKAAYGRYVGKRTAAVEQNDEDEDDTSGWEPIAVQKTPSGFATQAADLMQEYNVAQAA